MTTEDRPKDLDKISDLIRKCLALADSPNESEAEAAMSKAQELLEKYNLSMEEVKLRDQDSIEMIEGQLQEEQYLLHKLLCLPVFDVEYFYWAMYLKGKET